MADRDQNPATPKLAQVSRLPSPPNVSSSQSSLSPVPSEIGSIPEGLDSPPLPRDSISGSGSPASRRSERLRKSSLRVLESECSSTESVEGRIKRRKISFLNPTEADFSTRAHSDGLQSANKRSHEISKEAGSTQSKSSLRAQRKFQSRRDTKNDDIWPESNLRSQPLSSAVLSVPTPKYSPSQDNAPVELDIQHAFFAKLKQQQHTPIKSTESICDYGGRALPFEPFDVETPNVDLHIIGTNREPRGTVRTAASGTENGSNQGSAAQSPSDKNSKSTSAAKNGKGQNRLGRPRGRTGGNGGRDRDSPEPHEKAARTNDEQTLLKAIRQRQLELKKFYTSIGAQQMEALDIMSSRDLSKIHKRPAAHTKVPEYDDLLRSLQTRQSEVESLINREFRMRQDLAVQALQARKQVIESSFLIRAREAKTEHLKGAEGDLMILQNAHTSKVDETRTDNGSDGAANFPLYHELPEAHTRVRGYSSVRIDDEKPFKEHLASYDEQAQREVIDDDIVAPVMQSVARQNAERSAEAEKKAREKLDQLAMVSESELKQLEKYRMSRPQTAHKNPQFNLSRLADCADLVSQREREKKHRFVPVFARDQTDFSRDHAEKTHRPAQDLQRINTILTSPASITQSSGLKTPTTRKKKSISIPTRRATRDDEAQSQSSSSTSTPLPVIAPAPSRMPPPPASTHHHHHMPQHVMPPPPSSMSSAPAFTRHPSLTPITIPKARSPPLGSPAHNQSISLSSQIPPPPSPFQSRPSPLSPGYRSQPATRPLPQYQMVSQPQPQPPPAPPAPPSFLQQQTRLPPFDKPAQQQQQPVETPPPPPLPPSSQTQQPRFALNNSVSSHVLRPPGQRRNSGQITFTPTQTPSSERFTRPPGPPPQLPGRSVIRPAQLGNNNPSTPSRLGNVLLNAAPESRTQSAADIARQNAAKNQVQGAGPKGGRRVLLPKSN